MKVFLPEIDLETEEIKMFKPSCKKEYLQNNYNKIQKDVKVLINKPPVWDESKFLIKKINFN